MENLKRLSLMLWLGAATLVACSPTNSDHANVSTNDATVAPMSDGCTPRPWPDVDYCYAGEPGYEQRTLVGSVCETFAPSSTLPPTCDRAGPVTDWEPVWLEGEAASTLEITCHLSDGCPELLRSRSLTTSVGASGRSLGATRRLALRNGAALILLVFVPSDHEERRAYWRLASLSPELEFAWMGTDVSYITTALTMESGDILLSGIQSSGPHEPTPRGEAVVNHHQSFVARLDQHTGQARWVSHLATDAIAAQGQHNGQLHISTMVSCIDTNPVARTYASAMLALDLETGRVADCSINNDPFEEVYGPHWVGDTPVYQTTLSDYGRTYYDPSLSTFSSSGELEAIVSDLNTRHLDSLKLADGTWLFPLIEWLRLDADANLVSRTRPFGTPEDPYWSRFLPIIGYNDTTALAAGGSPLELVSTDALLEGQVEVKQDYRRELVHTGYGSLFALQDGTWLAFGGYMFHLVDNEGNVLWSARSGDPDFSGSITGQVLDDEHILVMASRSSTSGTTDRDTVVDFYVIHHVHGGVANTQHATLGYDIHKSWIPPANPVLDGPEIEPRWTLAE